MSSRFGPYLLGPLLGRGGMGEVHRATDPTQGGRAVALKVLAPHLSADPDYRARFRREAETASRLDEPHIVPIHRFGDVDGRLFLDMQLVDGPDLATVLLRGGPLEPTRAVAIVGQVAAALDAAHAAGLVHRDVKPANVLLRSPGPGRPEIALLTDFGIALDGAAGGDVHGTSEYLAPERIRGAPADHRVDVYALACVLFELLTGLRAFPGGEFAAQAHGHLHLPPPRPSQIARGVGPAMDAVIARGMAKDPARRHRSAGDLARDAHAALPGPGPSRRGLLIGAAALGGLAVAGGGAALLWRPRAPEPVVAEQALLITSTTPLDKFAVLPPEAGPVIAVIDPAGALRFWDVAGDTEAGVTLTGTQLTDVSVTTLDGRRVLVTGALGEAPGVVVARDLETGAPAGPEFPEPTGRVRAITATTVDGRPVVAAVGDDGTLRRWFLDDGTPLGTPVAPLADGVTPFDLRFVRTRGRTVLLRPAAGFGVRDVLDLATGSSLGSVQDGPRAALAELDGQPRWVALVEGALGVFDLSGGTEPLRTVPTTGARILAVTEVDGRPMAVVDDLENVLALRDLTTGATVGAPMAGHRAAVSGLGVVDVAGRPVLVSAALDNTIRVWDLAVRAATR